MAPLMESPSQEASRGPRRSLDWRTVLSTTAVQQLALLPTNSAPRPTREPSTQAFAPSTVLASLVENGPRVASDSRALPELPGRYPDGLLLREPFPSLAPKTQLLHQPKVATKRTRKMETKPTACLAKTTAFLTATAALMSRCKAHPASRPHHQHPLLWPLHHNISHEAFFIFFFFIFCIPRCKKGFSFYFLICFKPRKKSGLRLSAFCFIGPVDGNSGNMIISCLFTRRQQAVAGRWRKGLNCRSSKDLRKLEYRDHCRRNCMYVTVCSRFQSRQVGMVSQPGQYNSLLCCSFHITVFI